VEGIDFEQANLIKNVACKALCDNKIGMYFVNQKWQLDKYNYEKGLFSGSKEDRLDLEVPEIFSHHPRNAEERCGNSNITL
jgi:hypothetical protein